MIEDNIVSQKNYAVVGNPNSGKTTLFNALTGLRQKVGNYPGVTVEKKLGQFIGQHGEKIELLDLPGSYSLSSHAPDECVTRDVLLGLRSDTPRPDRILCVMDASHLERNLYFITQVLELGIPTIIALNMIDLANNQGITINIPKLSQELDVPVIACQANRKETLLSLKIALSRAEITRSSWAQQLPSAWIRAIDGVAAIWTHGEGQTSQRDPLLRMKSLLLLASPDSEIELLSKEMNAGAVLGIALAQRSMLDRELPSWREILVSARYERIAQLCKAAQGLKSVNTDMITHHLDEILTHPVWGWFGFLGVMGLMFISIFVVAAYPMSWIEGLFGFCGGVIREVMPQGDLRNLLCDGIIAGIGGVVTYLPQILVLFFFIGLLEDTGYMARAAFLMDRVMSKVGLHGKSFIPLLSSYACAIPGIMATRTIDNAKDRLVTILVAPLMTCSARLPVYALMIAALFPAGSVSIWMKGTLMMGLYLFGTCSALAFAWLFKKTILRGETSMFLMELPPYRSPVLKHIVLQMIQRAGMFLKRAGTVILGVSILLWFLVSFPKRNVSEDKLDKVTQLEKSYAGRLGHFIEPVIAPLGFDWKIGVGLVAAQTAREVFISTLAIIYHVEHDEKNPSSLSTTLIEETRPNGTLVYTPLTCISILVFFVLSMQCMSTLVVVRRETNSLRWPLFQFCYMTGAAYLASLLVYQGGKLLGFI